MLRFMFEEFQISHYVQQVTCTVFCMNKMKEENYMSRIKLE